MNKLLADDKKKNTLVKFKNFKKEIPIFTDVIFLPCISNQTTAMCCRTIKQQITQTQSEGLDCFLISPVISPLKNYFAVVRRYRTSMLKFKAKDLLFE